MTDTAACGGQPPGCPCHFVRGSPGSVVLLVLNWGWGPFSWACWLQSCLCSPEGNWPLLQRCTLAHHLLKAYQLLQSCSPAGQPPACTGNWVYSSPGADSAFAYSEIPEVPASPFLPLVLLATVLPSMCFSYSEVVHKFVESTLCPTIYVVIKTLRCIFSRTDSWMMPQRQHTSVQHLLFPAFTTGLWVQQFSQFSVHLDVYLSTLYLKISMLRRLGGTLSKTFLMSKCEASAIIAVAESSKVAQGWVTLGTLTLLLPVTYIVYCVLRNGFW